jgi:hypothetical protein
MLIAKYVGPVLFAEWNNLLLVVIHFLAGFYFLICITLQLALIYGVIIQTIYARVIPNLFPLK